jgi:hypothetical protein
MKKTNRILKVTLESNFGATRPWTGEEDISVLLLVIT